MEPPTKKARLEEAEEDAPTDKSQRIKQALTFHVEDTTMNVMQASNQMLLPLTDSGLQYLMAGARSNIGIRSGRYLFEVKIVEHSVPHEEPSAKNRLLGPRSQLRIGLATKEAALLLGESEGSVCFDSEGSYFRERRKILGVSQKLSTGDVVGLLINMDGSSPNSFTASLFCNGQRVTTPQPLPPNFKGEPLYPAVSFRNMALHYHFGPVPLAPLPFTCRMLRDASFKDVSVKEVEGGEQYEVIFPVTLPDEGGFDWLDQFLEANPSFTEFSDRGILRWCERSGIHRPKGYGAGARNCNDKPEIALGLQSLDDLSCRRVLQNVLAIQRRNLVVMEVKSNLLKEERKELLERWQGYKRVACVVVGEPPEAFKAFSQEALLRQKQEVLNLEFKARVQEERRKSQEKQPVDPNDSKKVQDALKRKAEVERRRREAEARGEVFEEEEEEPKDVDLKDAPKATLAPEEQKITFRKLPANDLSPYVLNTNFQKFSLPEEDEGFDEIRWLWQAEPMAKQHLEEWVHMKKLTSRLEDLSPGEWFMGKWKEWQKTIQSYQSKQNLCKAEVKKRSEEDKEEKGKNDLEQLDVFGVEDVTNVNGEPLFLNFTFEDWTLMSLRFELHLMAHAFPKDSQDPDRVAVPVEHLPFYYQKYYKKALTPKTFGLEACEEVVDLVRDTVLITGKSKVLEAQLPEDLESTNLFVMLTEESRRDRNRRIDMGDDSAKLKIQGQSAATGPPRTGPTLSQQVMALQARPPKPNPPYVRSPFGGEKGYEKGKGEGKGYEKGYEKGGYEKGGYDKGGGYWKGYEKGGYDKGYDKGYGGKGYGWEGRYQGWRGW